MTLSLFVQNLVNGISLGSMYALIAIGYTMVYGIIRLINFAHGDILMLAAYFITFGIEIFYLPWWAALICSIMLTALCGMLIEKVAYRPLRQKNASRISLLISSVGVSYFLENVAIVVFGGRPKSFYTPQIMTHVIKSKTISIPILGIIIPITTLVILAILVYIINKTILGMSMRACAKDTDTAKLMGIDVDKVITTTFAIGSALAAIGGIMWGLKYPQIHPLIGVMPGLKCFIAAVVGGIGNIPGAVLGGMVMGLGEIMLVALMPSLSGYRDAFAFIILILILLFKPTGILGEKMAEKV
ncbi:branched-chain amino acid ABC transporter permease [Tepidanaerobacter sp. EBM-49]|uniref:branched-chain amino acid ABC transporter permease n=1 Tax=Tepidanaerobacter sp. EBM-49 TaxID=1918504 RepID=UPI000B1B8C6A|nr:branched-chain amino acid ABC transporter permease [Tepidanaerobacter sp. EBM-49]